jgi:protein-L-isoaspartate(D-aspartate) O-methyltransferase
VAGQGTRPDLIKGTHCFCCGRDNAEGLHLGGWVVEGQAIRYDFLAEARFQPPSRWDGRGGGGGHLADRRMRDRRPGRAALAGGIVIGILGSLTAWLGLAEPAGAADDEARFAAARRQMVERQLKGRDITDPRVLAAMAKVLRHRFVGPRFAGAAYDDRPLPIGEGQTISQPYIVALMTQLLRPRGPERVLEVGTGSGYQAAVLAELVREVYTIEILPGLAATARARLDALGYANVRTRVGDGYLGWPEAAPFDGILVTAAPDHVPEPLVAQLKEGGRLVIPVGPEGGIQRLQVIEKLAGQVTRTTIIEVAFVPLIREKR